jgi:hypothetical protein
MMGACAITHSPTEAAIAAPPLLLLLLLLPSFPAIDRSEANSMLAFDCGCGGGCNSDGRTTTVDRKGDSGTTAAMLRLDTAVAAAKDEAEAEAEDSVAAVAVAAAAAFL